MINIEELKNQREEKNKEKKLNNFQIFQLSNNKKDDKLCWRVFVRDMNSDEIYAENLFNLNYKLNNEIYDIANKNLKFNQFEKEILQAIHEVWSRCQYEIYLTGNESDITKLKKIDVFTQLTMNWQHFVKYLWENKKHILKQFNPNGTNHEIRN